MCCMPDSQADIMELDESLIRLFRQWRSFMHEGIDKDCFKDMNWVEVFCTEMSNRLRDLEKQGALDAVFKP